MGDLYNSLNEFFKDNPTIAILIGILVAATPTLYRIGRAWIFRLFSTSAVFLARREIRDLEAFLYDIKRLLEDDTGMEVTQYMLVRLAGYFQILFLFVELALTLLFLSWLAEITPSRSVLSFLGGFAAIAFLQQLNLWIKSDLQKFRVLAGFNVERDFINLTTNRINELKERHGLE